MALGKLLSNINLVLHVKLHYECTAMFMSELIHLCWCIKSRLHSSRSRVEMLVVKIQDIKL